MCVSLVVLAIDDLLRSTQNIVVQLVRASILSAVAGE